MRIEEFVSKVKREMEKRTGKEIEIRETVRNNGVVRHALLVKDGQTNVAPVVYMEPYHAGYERGWGWGETMAAICNAYENGRVPGLFDAERFMDFEGVKGSVYYKLVNARLNRGLLEDVPYEAFLDLVKVYYVGMETAIGNCCITILKSHLEMWGISGRELKETAERNMANAEVLVNTLEEVLWELDEGYAAGLEGAALTGMGIMRLKGLEYGAAAMCNVEAVGRFAEAACADIVILPSSVYEVLLVPSGAVFGGETIGLEEFGHMVREINCTNVEPEERLSDNVYLYRRGSGEVELV